MKVAGTTGTPGCNWETAVAMKKVHQPENDHCKGQRSALLSHWADRVQSFKMLTEKIGHCTFKSTAFAFKHGLTGLSSLWDRAISSLAFKDWHFRIISLGQMLPAIMLPNSIIPQIDMICKYLRASLNCMTLLCCWFTSRINALCATILQQYFYATELLRSKWSTT